MSDLYHWSFIIMLLPKFSAISLGGPELSLAQS